MFLILVLVLYTLLANVVWPMIIQKSQFESKVMSYIQSNNITSPYCYGTYMGKVSKSFLGIDIDVGIDSTGKFLDCTVTPLLYYRCSPYDYTNVLHPCSVIKSYFRIFAL